MIFASGCKKLLTVKTKRAIAVSCLVLQVSSHLSVMGLLKTSLLRENTSKTRKRLNGNIPDETAADLSLVPLLALLAAPGYLPAQSAGASTLHTAVSRLQTRAN